MSGEIGQSASLSASPVPSTNRVDEIIAKAARLALYDPREGVRLSEQAVSSSEAIGYPRGNAEGFLHAGRCRVALGESERSLGDLLKAAEIFKSIGDADGQARSMDAIGSAYRQLGRLGTALDYYGASLDLSSGIGLRERQAETLNAIGEVYGDLANHEEALRYFRNALSLAKADRWPGLTARTLVNIAIAHKASQDASEAVDFLERALVLSDQAGDLLAKARCLRVLGQIFQELLSYDVAEGFYRQCIGACEASGNRLGRIETLLDAASLRVQQGDDDGALAWYEQALALSRELESRRHIARCARGMSALYQRRHRYKAALDYFHLYHRSEQPTMEQAVADQGESSRLHNFELRRSGEELREDFRRMEKISLMGLKIAASLDLDEIVLMAYESVRSLMDAPTFAIAVYNRSSDLIERRVFADGRERAGAHAVPVQSTSSFSAWCIRNRKPAFIRDVEIEYLDYLDGRTDQTEAGASLVSVPLTIQDRVVGLMAVYSEKKNTFAPRHLDQLKALGSYVGIAIENSTVHKGVNLLNQIVTTEKDQLEEAYRRIAHVANHDNLTGLPNRRLLSELLGKALPQAKREASRIAVLFIDLDSFKPVNDRFGHDAGDLVLQKIAQRFLSVLRSSDTIARVGGDEFVAVLTSIHEIDAARKVAEKLVAEVTKPIRLSSQSFRVGLSMGVSVYPDDDETISGLIRKADIAMYHVKQHARNGFAFYCELPRGSK